MNNDISDIDLDDVPTEGELIPKGPYTLAISQGERKPNSKGTGEILKLVVEVLDGPHKGRRVFEQLNIKHANQTAQNIGRGRFKAYCQAVGVMKPQTYNELFGIPFDAIIDTEESAGFAPKNVIKKVILKSEKVRAEKAKKQLANDDIPF